MLDCGLVRGLKVHGSRQQSLRDSLAAKILWTEHFVGRKVENIKLDRLQDLRPI
jgi:hypothetical protein